MNVKICFFIFYSFLSSFGRIVQSQGHGSIANSVFTDILDIDGRIQTLIYRIRSQIGPTITEVEKEIYYKNLKGMVVSIGFSVSSIFGAAKSSKGHTNLAEIPVGEKLIMLGHAMGGWGHATFYIAKYTNPRVDCGLKDFDKVLKEYEFLFDPESTLTNIKALFLTTKMNHRIKEKLFCLVSHSEEYPTAKRLVGLIDLLTEIQQEKFQL